MFELAGRLRAWDCATEAGVLAIPLNWEGRVAPLLVNLRETSGAWPDGLDDPRAVTWVRGCSAQDVVVTVVATREATRVLTRARAPAMVDPRRLRTRLTLLARLADAHPAVRLPGVREGEVLDRMESLAKMATAARAALSFDAWLEGCSTDALQTAQVALAEDPTRPSALAVLVGALRRLESGATELLERVTLAPDAVLPRLQEVVDLEVAVDRLLSDALLRGTHLEMAEREDGEGG